jgi:hypothetical protein
MLLCERQELVLNSLTSGVSASSLILGKTIRKENLSFDIMKLCDLWRTKLLGPQFSHYKLGRLN